MESTPKLSTPEEELAYLREKVSQKEQELAGRGAAPNESDRTRIVSETIHEHHAAPVEVLAPDYRIGEGATSSAAEQILKELNLGGSEEAVKSVGRAVEEEGVKNALSILEKLGDPHVADDFHRYLVQYVAAGLMAPGTDEKAPRFQALKMTLYEIALPAPKNVEQNTRVKSLKELVSSMEQLYAGLLSVSEAEAGEPHYYALELAIPADSPELQFYAAVPNSKKNLFEKQLLAVFPNAHL